MFKKTISLSLTLLFFFSFASFSYGANQVSSSSCKLVPDNNGVCTTYHHKMSIKNSSQKIGVYIDTKNNHDVQWSVTNANNDKIYGQGFLTNKNDVVNKRYSVPPGNYYLTLKCRYSGKYCNASGTISKWQY